MEQVRNEKEFHVARANGARNENEFRVVVVSCLLSLHQTSQQKRLAAASLFLNTSFIRLLQPNGHKQLGEFLLIVSHQFVPR